jgi:ATP-dependent Clp protease ATP-binding subunit ClpB
MSMVSTRLQPARAAASGGDRRAQRGEWGQDNFRPEFLNRIDDVVVFRSLTKVDLRKIVDIQLRRLDKLLADRRVTLELTEEAKLRLVDLGYEPALGARPLRRAILKQVQNPLAESLLGNRYPEGTTIKVSLNGEKFTFTV